MSSADFTIYTPALELSLIRSHLAWGEFSAFSAVNAIHSFPVFVPPGTHHCWVDRGGMVWEVLPNTSTHELTTMIWWELVNLSCSTICVRQPASLYQQVLQGQWLVPLDATRQQHAVCALSKALRHVQWFPAMGVRCYDHSTMTADVCMCVVHYVYPVNQCHT